MIHHIKRTDKYHRIILINTEKAFEKIQHSFMIKTGMKAVIEGIYQNIINLFMTHPELTSYSMVKC